MRSLLFLLLMSMGFAAWSAGGENNPELTGNDCIDFMITESYARFYQPRNELWKFLEKGGKLEPVGQWPEKKTKKNAKSFEFGEVDKFKVEVPGLIRNTVYNVFRDHKGRVVRISHNLFENGRTPNRLYAGSTVGFSYDDSNGGACRPDKMVVHGAMTPDIYSIRKCELFAKLIDEGHSDWSIRGFFENNMHIGRDGHPEYKQNKGYSDFTASLVGRQRPTQYLKKCYQYPGVEKRVAKYLESSRSVPSTLADRENGAR